MNAQGPARATASGTRPEGARDEQESAARVREMFSRIAPRYDFLNHLLSFQLDRVWRRRVVSRFRHILARADARVLDLCCGTGDLAIVLRRGGRAAVVGGDFAHPMLVRALEKTEQLDSIAFVESDALRLPFADASFDLVTTAFGFRNLANYERGLREMRRVLAPGGEVSILEFSEARGVFGPAYRFYLRRIVPRLGGAVSGSPAAYSYLPASVAQFPGPGELAAMMESAGFRSVRFERWTFGSVALHRGRVL